MPLSWKVKSAIFNVELHDGRLWGVADCQLLESWRMNLTASPTICRDKPVTAGARASSSRRSPWAGGLLYVHQWDGQDWEMITTGAGGRRSRHRWGCPHEPPRKSLGGTEKPMPSGRACTNRAAATLSIRTASTSTWCGTTSFTSNGKSRKPSLCTRILKCTGGNCLPW